MNYAEVDSDSDASSDRGVEVKVIRNKGKGKAKAAQDRDFSPASRESFSLLWRPGDACRGETSLLQQTKRIRRRHLDLDPGLHQIPSLNLNPPRTIRNCCSISRSNCLQKSVEYFCSRVSWTRLRKVSHASSSGLFSLA